MGGLGADGAVQERFERRRHGGRGSSRDHLHMPRKPNHHIEFNNGSSEIGEGAISTGRVTSRSKIRQPVEGGIPSAALVDAGGRDSQVDEGDKFGEERGR